MRKSILGILLLSLCVYGCVAIPGGIRTATSDFDGAKEVSMEPAWVCKEGTFGSCAIKFGLHWRSTMPKDRVVLVAMASGINAFSSGPSLHFNIDGTFVAFTSMDELTDFQVMGGTYIRGVATPGGYVPGWYIPPTNWSSQRYLVDKTFLEAILKAQRVAVRVDLRTGYVEGLFSKDDPTTARPGVRDFYKEVFGGEQTGVK
jgi:hypothetical protein